MIRRIYFLSEDGVKTHELKDIRLSCLETVTRAKLNPIGVVCDASAVNQKLYEKKIYFLLYIPILFLGTKLFYLDIKKCMA